MATAELIKLPLLRGSHEGADCSSCPFSTNGMPTKPVFSEYPENPDWVIVGEGPGWTEQRLGRPFVGASGDVVNKILNKIGRPRDQLFVGNITACMPPQGSPEAERQRAATACKPRLVAELAMFPGKPVLTLGAVAARALIPQEVLDSIDPPDAPKAIKRQQKLRSIPVLKNAIKRRKAVDKETTRQLKKLLAHERKRIVVEIKVRHKQRPPESYIQNELNRVHARLLLRAREVAIKVADLKIKEREIKKKLDSVKPKKKAKAKQIKITDIVGTLFDVDIDGSGVRPLIPGIHPAALLRGGGASIGGSHTPDMGYVNLIFDAAKVDNLAKGKDVRLKLNVEYEIEDPTRALQAFLRVYNDALLEDACSLDLETYVDDPDKHHALMAYVAKIRVIGLSTKKMSVSMAWDLLPSVCQSLLQALIMNVEMTYHNGLYDRTVLMAYGFVMGPRWFDTLLAHHASYPGNSHRLQTVAAQFFGVTPWKSEYKNADEDPVKLAVYNAKDTGSTHALRAPLAMWVKRTDTQRVYDLDLKMSDAASRMHLAGMPVDREINADLKRVFTKQVIESRRHVEDIAKDPKQRELIWHHLAIQQAGKRRKLDPDDFEARYNIRLEAMKLDPDWKWKIGSGKHIAALLLAMGVGLYQTTDGGDISTKKEVLESHTDEPIVRDIIDFREADKLNATFVIPVFDQYDMAGQIMSYGFADENDRIHPIWNVHRISGRWASAWPVVSNVPKDRWKKYLTALFPGTVVPEWSKPKPGETNECNEFWIATDVRGRINKDGSIAVMTRPNLRKQIRPTVKGRVLVGFDFGQIEARVIALVSGDPFFCDIFAKNMDPHVECAKIIWGDKWSAYDSDMQKQLRENVKNIEYGYLYMAQLDTLHKTMLKAGNMIKLQDLALAIDKLTKAMPDIKGWQTGTIARAMQPPHELRDFVLGRRRCWPMGNVEGPEAVNASVQFAAAAIMNTGMALMMPKLDAYQQAWPIAQIHDAAVFECWEDDAARLAADCKESFEQTYERSGRTIPFPIDVKIGPSWDRV